MSKEIVAAIIGAGGAIFAALIPQLYAWWQVKNSNYPTSNASPTGNWPGGELLDIRELRILRALVGEDEGRQLHIYRNNEYYRSVFDSLINKDLIQQINGKYRLTDKGNKYTSDYLKWLSKLWKPGNSM